MCTKIENRITRLLYLVALKDDVIITHVRCLRHNIYNTQITVGIHNIPNGRVLTPDSTDYNTILINSGSLDVSGFPRCGNMRFAVICVIRVRSGKLLFRYKLREISQRECQIFF